MSIQVGSDKIKEVYVGNQSIGYVYSGSDLVWQNNPYPINTVIANTQTAGSVTLYSGTYELKISGAGGTGGSFSAGWGTHSTSGGSGACWEGTITINGTVPVSWTTGTGAQASVTVTINNVNVVTAGGGGNSTPSSAIAGVAGILTVQSAFNTYIATTSNASNGNAGSANTVAWGAAGIGVTAAPSTMGWGVGANSSNGGRTDGGFYLKRIA